MAHARVCFAVTLFVLAGCANLNTIGRRSTLPAGTAIHLDAPQRLAFSNEKGWVCAEPSPDALQAYASSLGAGYSAPSKDSVSIAQALSASAGSIGLRTQSITLMRDALYRICELYYDGAISKMAAIQLLQRSQDLSLGVLAIEQLTGAVVAQQVKFNTSGTSAAAASINDIQKELDRAKADESSKKDTLDAADKALTDAKKKAADAKTAADAAKGNAVATQKIIDDATPKRDAAKANAAAAHANFVKADKSANSLQDQLDKIAKGNGAPENSTKADLQKQLELAKSESKAAAEDEKAAADAAAMYSEQIAKAEAVPEQAAAEKASADSETAAANQKKKQDALDSAKAAYEQAQANTAKIAQLGSAATSSANASVGGASDFSTATMRYGVDKDTVKALTQGTVAIVDHVLNKGHITDTCGVMLMSQEEKPLSPELFALCQKVIEKALEVWVADAVAARRCRETSCTTPPAKPGTSDPALEPSLGSSIESPHPLAQDLRSR